MQPLVYLMAIRYLSATIRLKLSPMRFKYGRKYPLIAIIPLISCIGGAIYIFSQCGISLEQMPSQLFSLLFAILVLFLGLSYNMVKRLTTKSHLENIELKSDHLIFTIDKERKTIKYDDIEKIWSITLYTDDDSANQKNRQASIVTTSKEKYDFREEKFETKQEYDAFFSHLKHSCKNTIS